MIMRVVVASPGVATVTVTVGAVIASIVDTTTLLVRTVIASVRVGTTVWTVGSLKPTKVQRTAFDKTSAQADVRDGCRRREGSVDREDGVAEETGHGRRRGKCWNGVARTGRTGRHRRNARAYNPIAPFATRVTVRSDAYSDGTPARIMQSVAPLGGARASEICLRVRSHHPHIREDAAQR
jgi:hypothetical protein